MSSERLQDTSKHEKMIILLHVSNPYMDTEIRNVILLTATQKKVNTKV